MEATTGFLSFVYNCITAGDPIYQEGRVGITVTSFYSVTYVCLSQARIGNFKFQCQMLWSVFIFND